MKANCVLYILLRRSPWHHDDSTKVFTFNEIIFLANSSTLGGEKKLTTILSLYNPFSLLPLFQ